MKTFGRFLILLFSYILSKLHDHEISYFEESSIRFFVFVFNGILVSCSLDAIFLASGLFSSVALSSCSLVDRVPFKFRYGAETRGDSSSGQLNNLKLLCLLLHVELLMYCITVYNKIVYFSLCPRYFA